MPEPTLEEMIAAVQGEIGRNEDLLREFGDNPKGVTIIIERSINKWRAILALLQRQPLKDAVIGELVEYIGTPTHDQWQRLLSAVRSLALAETEGAALDAATTDTGTVDSAPLPPDTVTHGT